jgi:hypothetical protein
MTRTSGMSDYSDRTVPSSTCAKCGETLQPQPMAYNRRYCSNKCKRAARDTRERKSLQGRHGDDGKSRQRAYVRGRLRGDPGFKEAHTAATYEYRKRVRDWLAAYKLESGCVDCGYRGHFSALQLDHEGPKTVSIADARTSIARLQAEIESGQCKVRCANCHSIRTWERKHQKKGAA